MKYSNYYGDFGGSFIPEILYENFQELTQAFNKYKKDPVFWQEYISHLKEYSGRPTPITYAKNLSTHFKGAQILIKREDLNHSGAHKINNAVGQALLAKRMGKKRLIAETGAGQHGVAVATAAARLGFSCTIYMGETDVNRQYSNVFWMRQLGATVKTVTAGNKTLKEAINECFRDWSINPESTYYVLGTACGPHPFPSLVSWLQSIIGKEAKKQILKEFNYLPAKIFASVGGGSNALGVFQAFLNDKTVELVAVEAGGKGIDTKFNALRLASKTAKTGIAQGYKTLFMQDDEGQMLDTHSVAAGLDYIGVSPILAHLLTRGRIKSEAATDQEVVQAAHLVMQQEGIIPALESSHAFAQAFKELPKLDPSQFVLINLSGRGDKDIFTFGEAFKDENWQEYLRFKTNSKSS